MSQSVHFPVEVCEGKLGIAYGECNGIQGAAAAAVWWQTREQRSEMEAAAPARAASLLSEQHKAQLQTISEASAELKFGPQTQQG